MEVPDYDDFVKLEDKVDDLEKQITELNKKTQYIIDTLIKPGEEWVIFIEGFIQDRPIAKFYTKDDADNYIRRNMLKRKKSGSIFSKSSLLYGIGNAGFVKVKPVYKNFYNDIPMDP